MLKMETAERIKELHGSGSRRKLGRLARELLESDTVNDVSMGILAADRLHSMTGKDSHIRIAVSGMNRMGSLFTPELTKVLDYYGILSQQFGDELSSAASGKTDLFGELRYSRTGDRALLLNGDEERYSGYAGNFREFLFELGFLDEHIYGVDIHSGGDMSDFVISASMLTRNAEQLSNLVVYYAGHGDPGVMKPRDGVKIGYKKWAWDMKGHKGNMAFVNDTCHAQSARYGLGELGLLPDRIMLLSGAGESEIGRGGHFSEYVMETFRSGEPYAPRDACDKANSGEERPSVSVIAVGLGRGGGFIGVGKPQEENICSDCPKTVSYPKDGAPFDYMLIK